MKRKKITIRKKILICLATIFVAVFIASAIYVNDYYRADTYATEVLDKMDYSVKQETDKNDNIIFYPEDQNNLNIGFIFYPGAKVEYTAYAPLMYGLAQNGITTIIIKMPFNLAILGKNGADGILEQFPDITRWYIGGHSLGGATASMYLEKTSYKFEGLVLLGAYSSVDLSKENLSVLSIYGRNDNVLNKDKYFECKSNLPDTFTEYVVEGGCHAYFGSYGEQKGDGTATITPKQQQEITIEQILDFIVK